MSVSVTGLEGRRGPFDQKLLSKILSDSAIDPDNLFTCFFGDPREFVNPKVLCDYGALLLFLLTAIVVLSRRDTLDIRSKRVAYFVVLAVLLVPPCLHFLAHYRAMYRWMTYMPLC